MARAVYLVPPPGSSDGALREAAQEGLRVLVAALPSSEHAAYLDEVRVVSDLDDVRRALQRSRPRAPGPAAADDAVWHIGLAAVLAADSPDELMAELERHPALASEAADGWLARQHHMAQSADVTLARAIGLVRQAIARARRGGADASDAPEPGLAALLAARDAAQAAAAVAEHPALLSPAPRARLDAWIDEAAREGDLMRAHALIHRADALDAAIAEARQPAMIAAGIASLAGAGGPAEQSACIRRFPGLCSDAGRSAVRRAIAAGQLPVAAWPALCAVCGA
jgi:ribonuclease HII